MSTGDPTCQLCGSQIPCIHSVGWPYVFPNSTQKDDKFAKMLADARKRQKDTMQDQPPTARNVHVVPNKPDLIAYLTAYLGDSVFAARFADCMEMIRQKNADYSQGEAKGDRIAAFRRIGRDINVPMPKVWAIFAQKHWGAVMKYVKDGVVESEPIEGRIGDLINYFVLLDAIIKDQEETKG